MPSRLRRAFAMTDLAALAGVAGIGACLALASLPHARRASSLGQTVSNIKQVSDTIASYASDRADAAPGFTWKKGDMSSGFADLRNPATDLDAAAYQFVDIVRRRSNVPTFAKVSGFIPHVSYIHTVLADYLNTPLPLPFVVSPEDRNLVKWSSDPSKWQQNGAPSALVPFRSSYEWFPGLWALTDSGANAISQDGLAWNTYSVPGSTVVGQRQLSAIAFPAQKVEVYDLFQRHFGPRVGFFMYDEARVPAASFDGSVALRAGKNTNNGWKPQAPSNAAPSLISYQPSTTDPPALNGLGSETVRGKWRWTRKSVLGRDFDGAEVN